MALIDKLTAIGDAIREKEGSTDLIALNDMPSRIIDLPTGGGSGDVENDAVRQSYINSMKFNDNVAGSITITIPKEAQLIRTSAFSGWNELGAVVLEDHKASELTLINDSAFINCSYLKSIEWPENISHIGQSAFANCTELEIDELPESIFIIKSYAFKQCKKLTISKLPPNVMSVSNYTFQECIGLQLTSLPEGVTSIGNYAFDKACDTSVTRELFTIPSTVTSIGTYAFRGQNFKKIRFMGTPTSIMGNAFSNSDVTDIYVPWTHSDVVQSSPWGATNATIHYNTSPDEVIE